MRDSRHISQAAIAIFLMAFCFWGSPAQAQWTQQSPIPTFLDIGGVAFPTPAHGFICGPSNFLMETNDGGATWNSRSVSTSGGPYTDIFFIDANNGWISGNSTAIGSDNFRTTDGGATWQQLSNVPFGSWSNVDFVSPTTGWLSGNGGTALTTDGGTSWQLQSGAGNVFGMDFWDSNSGLVGGLSGVLKTTDGGATWSSTYSANAVNEVVYLDANTALAADPNVLLRSTDGGQTWTPTISDPLGYGWTAVVRIDAVTAIAMTFGGDIHRTTDGGATWMQVFTGPVLPLFVGAFANTTTGYAVGNEGIIVKSTDGGATWNYISNGAGLSLFDLKMYDDVRGFAVGDIGIVLTTSDGGTTWTPSRPGLNSLKGLSLLAPNFAFAAGNTGAMVKTTDGGLTWTEIIDPGVQQFNLEDVKFVSTTEGWIVGDLESVFHTTDGGNTWTSQTPLGSDTYTCVDFANSSLGWISGGTFNNLGIGVLRTTNGGATWNLITVPNLPWIHDLQFIDTNVGWIVGFGGYIARSTDGGLTWQQQNSGITDDITSVHVLSQTEAWAVSNINGFVLHTTDAGQTWQNVPTGFANANFDAVFATTSGKVWAAGYNGMILFNGAIPPGNQPPTATITQPQNGAVFAPGSTLSFAGDATDPEDGVVAASGFTWTAITPTGGSIIIGQGVKSGSVAIPGNVALGNYTIRLDVVDSGGTSDSDQVGIIISNANRPPTAVASASPTSGTAPLTVNFTGSGSSDPDGQIVSYNWTFGDGGTSTQADPVYIYQNAGTFTATLTVTDNGGATDSDQVGIVISNVNQPPTATITQPQNGAVFARGATMNFAGDATDPEDGVVAASGFTWTAILPNGNPVVFAQGTKSGSVVIPATAPLGNYTIRLDVVDSGGATDDDQVGITISATAKASASVRDLSAATLIPTEYKLYDAYPNPFNPETRIRFALPKSETVRMQIFNAVGWKVRTLVDGVEHAAGLHTYLWNGKDDQGRNLPSGLYYLRIEAGELRAVKKLSLVK